MSLEVYLDDEGEEDTDDADVEEGPDPDVAYDQWREARLFGV